ncbi:MAG: hypothetical protein ABIX37_11735 [Gammaproteobacteria bacterium]
MDADTVAIFHPGAVTADAFARGNHDLARQLVDFVSCLNPGIGALVLSMGEVDIRTHYWRDLPILVSRGVSVQQVIETKVRAFVHQVTGVCEHFGFPEAILWGPPASNVPGTASNEEFPTTGDNATRNILTHLFSRECFAIANAGHPRFRFATLFYDMVSDDFGTQPGWLADGVHMAPDLKFRCLDRLAPVVARQVTAVAGDRIDRFNRLSFQLADVPVSSSEGNGVALPYRTWLSTDHSPQIAFGGTTSGYSLADGLSGKSTAEPVSELVLRSLDVPLP